MKFNLSPQLSELIGVIIGDGCIRYKPKYNQYYIEIVGDKLWYVRDQSTGEVYNYWLNGTQISSNSIIASPFGITTNL